MFDSPSTQRRAFTLVEMLVVLGIIAILAALLLPAAMNTVTRARNAAIALEINQIASAIEAYKADRGDYPPNFRDQDVFLRHVRRCYPKINQTYLTAFANFVFPVGAPPRIDEGEALVFWLSKTTTDAQYPFGPFGPASGHALAYKKYYPFDDSRAVDGNADGFASYQAKHCKDTFYIYIDSRSYTTCGRLIPMTAMVTPYAYAEDRTIGVRPYLSDPGSVDPPYWTNAALKRMNHDTFQLICAGQDGDFGLSPDDPDLKVFVANTTSEVSNHGIFFNRADEDNITNFSAGKRLGDFNK